MKSYRGEFISRIVFKFVENSFIFFLIIIFDRMNREKVCNVNGFLMKLFVSIFVLRFVYGGLENVFYLVDEFLIIVV